MSKKISIGFGILTIVLTALLVLPDMISLDRWKPELEKKVSEALGRSVSIGGKLGFYILPFPGVSLRNVRVANEKGAHYLEMMTAEEITVTVAFLPLFMRTIEFSQIKLSRPDIHLEVSKKGQGNWDFPQLSASNNKQPESDDSSGWSFKTTIPRINILEGALTYRDQSGQEFHVTHFQTSLKSNSVKGPFELKGQLELEKESLKFDVTLGSLDERAPIPLNIHLINGDQRLQVIGKLDWSKKSFGGQFASKLEPYKFLGDASPIKNTLSVTGKIAADEKEMKLTDIGLSADNLQAKGMAELSYDQHFSYLISLKGLPGKTDLEIKAPKEEGASAKGYFSLTSKDLPVLVSWLSPSVDYSEFGKSLKCDASFAYKGEDGQVNLDKINLVMGDKTLSGAIHFGKGVIKADITTPHINPWFKLVKVDNPVKFGKANFNGEIKLGHQVDINAGLQFAGGHIKTKGYIIPASQRYDFDIDLIYPDLRGVGHSLGVDLAQTNLGEGNISFNLSGTQEKFSVSHIKGSIGPKSGKFDFRGSASVNFDEKKPTLKGNINIGDVNVDSLLLAPKPLKKQSSAKKKKVSEKKENWSTEKIDLKFLQQFDAHFDIKMASLRYKDLLVKKINFPINVKHGTLTCAPIRGKVNGGELNSSFSLSYKVTNKIDFSLNLKDASLEQFIALIADHQIRGGSLNADIKVNSAGNSMFGFIENLNGYANLDAADGSFTKFDVASIVKNVKSLSDPTALLSIFEKSSGQTKFSKMIFKSNIHKGIIGISTLSIEAPQIEGEGGGAINLPQYFLDIYTNIKVKALDGAPKVEVQVKGSLDDPKVSYDVEALKGYLFKKAGSGLINRFLGGAAGGSVAGPVGTIVGGVLGAVIPDLGDKLEKKKK